MGNREEIINFKPVDPTRRYFHYLDLEEYHAGMWKPVTKQADRPVMIAKAIRLLRNKRAFTTSVNQVISRWKNSCEAEFTSPGNHKAWLGQAACCLKEGIPESMTRLAWWKLTEQQREVANVIAQTAIDGWQKDNA